MQTVTSGTSTERIVRAGSLMILLDVFTVLFLWDGYIGYAQKNAADFARLLGLPAEEVLAPDSAWSAKRAAADAAAIKAGEPVEAVVARLGPPTATKEGEMYYLGSGGWLRIAAQAGRVQAAAWQPAPRTEADQRWQRWIGYVLGVLGAAATLRLALVMSTRAAVCDQGVKIGARPVIPWDAIVSLRQVDRRDGGVELTYTADDRPQSLHLDSYRYKNLGALVAAISERKGFVELPASASAGGESRTSG